MIGGIYMIGIIITSLLALFFIYIYGKAAFKAGLDYASSEEGSLIEESERKVSNLKVTVDVLSKDVDILEKENLTLRKVLSGIANQKRMINPDGTISTFFESINMVNSIMIRILRKNGGYVVSVVKEADTSEYRIINLTGDYIYKSRYGSYSGVMSMLNEKVKNCEISGYQILC